MKNSSIIFSILVGVSLISCNSDEPLTLEKSKILIDNVLTSLNISNAHVIYYKDTNTSDVENDYGYYKLGPSGNVVKLEISDNEGVVRNIGIDRMTKLSDRYLLFEPNIGDLCLIIKMAHDNWQDVGSEMIREMCSIACIVDNQTGTLYKIPQIIWGTYSNLRATVNEVNGIYYFNGFNGDADFSLPGVFLQDVSSQIFAFNPCDLTISALLSEDQLFTNFIVNDLGYIGYWNKHTDAPIKVKCPGGNLIQLGNGPLLTIDNTFYTIDENENVSQWMPNDANSLTSVIVCKKPDTHTTVLNNKLQNVCLINGWDQSNLCTYQFDGNEFTKLSVVVPDEMFNVSFETSDAWYNANDDMILKKLSKIDYSVTYIDVSRYNFTEFVATVDSPDVLFTGIRYPDFKRVIGKIDIDNNIEIEIAFTTDSTIYNLIPID